MKQNNFIRDAIDESLSSIRFDAKDARSVLRSVRNREELPQRRPVRKPRFQFALAMAMTFLVIAPVALFALRAGKTGTTHFTAAPGSETAAPAATVDPHADRIITADASARSDEENEAIRIARVCFESVCDTSIFTFEEYAVNTDFSEGDNGLSEYTVTMTSIYGNGCTFTVRIAFPSGEVLEHSTPELATIPVYLDSSLPEIKAWYDKYGPIFITWPQDAQAEFSRRYEGGMLRTAKEGEVFADHAVTLAKELVAKHLPAQDKDINLYGYAMLYSERAGEDGSARYVVSVYPSAIADSLPELLGTVSFKPDGSDVVVTLQ